ncbi:Tetratricopeptide repeat protein 16 [Chytridiales sp. JEL 0842]|nr:Tetratricopeptide repeat protein 16 [Chytridiales sp. JEL 0842]
MQMLSQLQTNQANALNIQALRILHALTVHPSETPSLSAPQTASGASKPGTPLSQTRQSGVTRESMDGKTDDNVDADNANASNTKTDSDTRDTDMNTATNTTTDPSTVDNTNKTNTNSGLPTGPPRQRPSLPHAALTLTSYLPTTRKQSLSFNIAPPRIPSTPTLPSALGLLGRALYLDPTEGSFYIHRAEVCVELGDWESALGNMEKGREVVMKRLEELDREREERRKSGEKKKAGVVVDRRGGGVKPSRKREQTPGAGGETPVVGTPGTPGTNMPSSAATGVSTAPSTAPTAKPIKYTRTPWIDTRLRRLHFTYAQILLDLRLFTLCIRHAQRAIELSPPPSPSSTSTTTTTATASTKSSSLTFREGALLLQAAAHLGLSDPESAHSKICTLLQSPHNQQTPDLYALRAKILRTLGDIPGMNTDVRTLMKLDPGHAELKGLLAFVLMKAVEMKNEASKEILKGRWENGVWFLTQALELDEGDWMSLLKRGLLFAELGHVDNALEDLHSVLEHPEHDTTRDLEVRAHLGSVYNMMGVEACADGKSEEALKAFTTALEYSPNEATIYKNRADLHITLSNTTSALIDLRQSHTLDPTHEPTTQLLVSLLTTQARQTSLTDPSAALRSVGEAAEVSKFADPDVLVLRARLRWGYGDVDGAREDLERCVDLGAGNGAEVRGLWELVQGGRGGGAGGFPVFPGKKVRKGDVLGPFAGVENGRKAGRCGGGKEGDALPKLVVKGGVFGKTDSGVRDTNGSLYEEIEGDADVWQDKEFWDGDPTGNEFFDAGSSGGIRESSGSVKSFKLEGWDAVYDHKLGRQSSKLEGLDSEKKLASRNEGKSVSKSLLPVKPAVLSVVTLEKMLAPSTGDVSMPDAPAPPQSQASSESIESLKSLLASLDTRTFHFQKQISHWIQLQENPEAPNADGTGPIEDDRTEKLDVRGLLLGQPKNMEAELRFHKELFSKLKFNFLEQTTKETFLKRVLAVPVQWPRSEEIREAEAKNESLKENLKAYKAETESAKEELESLVEAVCERYESLMELTKEAESVLQSLSEKQEELERLQQLVKPDMKTTSELQAIVDEQNSELERLQSELENLNSQIAEKKAKTAEMEENVKDLQTQKSEVEFSVAEAEMRVKMRDAKQDECQTWTEKLMEIQAIKSVDAVSTSCLRVTFFLGQKMDTVTLELNLLTPDNMGQVMVDAKFLDFPCPLEDLVEASKTYRRLAPTTPLTDTLRFLVSESHSRLRKHHARLTEIDELGYRSKSEPWKIAYEPSTSVVKIIKKNAKYVEVRLDSDYPRHSSCMEIVGVGPEGTFADVETLQGLLDEKEPATLTDLIPLLL